MENNTKVNDHGVLVEKGRILITAKSIIFSGNGFVGAKIVLRNISGCKF